MTSSVVHPRLSRLISGAAAAYAVSGGVITLLGWALARPRLTDWINSGISMFPNTAVCAVLSGLTLSLLQKKNGRDWIFARILAIVVAVMGGLTLSEHILDLNLGIDTLLFSVRPWGQLARAAPMRMGPPASTSFIILGIGLFLATCRTRGRQLASVFAITAVAIASLSLVGYAFSADQLFIVARLTGIALPTSTIVAVLGIGLTAAIPEIGLTAMLGRQDAGGLLARRLLLPIVAVPFVFGWLLLMGQQAGLFDTAFGTAAMVLITISMLVLLLYRTASSISRQSRIAAVAEEGVRDSEARLAAILEQIPIAVGVISCDGNWILGNAGMRRFVPAMSPSRDPARLSRWHAQDHNGEELQHDQWPSARALRGEVVSPGIEFRYQNDDRREIWTRVGAAPLRDPKGEIVGAMVIVQDIDDIKRAEMALRESETRKDEFLATLAHELRNPLAPLRSAIELMKRANDGPVLEQARKIMDRQVEQMVRLVDDLLDVNRITKGKIQLRKERVELAAVIRHAVEASRPQIEAQGHQLTIRLPDEPIYLDVDVTRLAQVLTNLLTNAAKYTDRGGQIWVSAELEGAEVAVSVRDNGIGIAAEHLPRIFEMFSQIQPALERSQGGLGIGLSLVKRLVEMHGGSVQVFSAGPGRGSEFVVRLPVLITVVDAVAPAAVFTEATRLPRRVLIVDDNADSADVLAVLIEMMGNQTHTAYDGLDAVHAAETFRPHVVLLDIGLPRMNGYDVCREIRRQPWGESIVIIAVTGWGQEEDRRRSQEAGFNGHLVKPIGHEALNKLLAGLPSAPVKSGAASV